MAAALLASPSVAYDSPDSSFSSSEGEHSSSPRLPALSSPFNSTTTTPHDDEEDHTSTPTRSTTAPNWVTEELEEEWVQQEEGGSPSSSKQSTPSPAGSITYSSHVDHSPTTRAQLSPLDRTKPRIPSSLRYSSVVDVGGASIPPLSPDSSTSAGTFVMRSSNPGTKSGGVMQGLGGGGENQLQAAVRALKGPSAGLGGREQEEEGEDVQEQQQSPKKDRLGLMSLFDPPSPPPALPPSTIIPPSTSTFTFAPPTTGPRSSWKALEHFSPESESNDESTPVARLPGGEGSTTLDAAGAETMQLALDETPSRPARGGVPAPRVKERYLHRSVRAEAGPNEEEEEEQAQEEEQEDDLHPFPTTPASLPRQPNTPQPATGTPALKLFSFQYDTFTRNHLAALVDEIDELGASPPSHATREQEEEELQAWETSFVEVPTSTHAVEERDEEEERAEEEGDDSQESLMARGARSTKRIRLSPTLVREEVGSRQGAEGEYHGSEKRRRRRSARCSSGGGGGAGFRTALGASAARRGRGLRHSPTPSSATAGHPTRLLSSAPRSSFSSRASHPFARSLDLSARLASPSPARFDHSPSPSPIAPKLVPTTRDRLAEANDLLERIRAKTAEREERRPPPPLRAGPLPDVESEEEKEEEEEDAPLLTPQKPQSTTERFVASNPSPRKLLRRLSASDEVDHEEFEEEEEGEDQAPPLPHLAAAATASLREALVQSSSSSSSSPCTPAGASLGVVGGGRRVGAGAGRRHFARTPVSQSTTAGATRRNRGRLEEVFPNSSVVAAVVPEEKEEAEEGEGEKVVAVAVATPGHGHARHRSLTTIGPNDVEALLASASAPSRMVFDREQGRWIKTARTVVVGGGGGIPEQVGEEPEERSTSTEDSEDPFRDFDSTRASGDLNADASRLSSLTLKEARAEAVDAGLEGLGIMAGTPLPTPTTAVGEEEERVQRSSPEGACYFEPPPVEGGREEIEEIEEEEEDTGTWGREGEVVREDEEEEEEEESPLQLFRAAMRASVAVESAGEEEEEEGAEADDDETDLFQPTLERATTSSTSPARLVSLPLPPSTLTPARLATCPTALSPTTPKPAPSSSNATPRPTIPRSALKTRSQSAPLAGATPSSSSSSATLADSSRLPPRSVSFSDGRTSGKIEGLIVGSRLRFEVSTSTSTMKSSEGSGGGASGMFGAGEPGSLEMSEGEEGLLEERGSVRTRRIEDALEELQGAGPPDATSSIIISSFDSAPLGRARADRSVSQSQSQSRTFRRTTHADATFLTECSFGVSADRLLQYITDVQPFEPDWEGMKGIDLSGKGAESVVRLKEFLPTLDEVNLNNNELAFLTGVPSTLRTLLLAQNRISSLTSFSHLQNLERIDISHNHVDSVHQLACLRHLRELKADGNAIEELSGLAGMDGLVKLSLRGNKVKRVDFGEMRWHRLETLNLSRNEIVSVEGVETLQTLSLLNLDHNLLTSYAPRAPMPRLRVLRICNNPIESLDVGFATKLRTLFIDGARLGAVEGTEELRKLENLSVRDQTGGGLTFGMTHLRDVKRLYLSGNPIPSSFPSEKFFNLVYLELAMCQLSTLPPNLAAVVPNVRVLNLNFNFLQDLQPLKGLTRVTKLTVVGGRLAKCRPVASVLGTMGELEELDLRMNPLTLPFYPPYLTAPTPTRLPPHAEHEILPSSSSSSAEWSALDTKFRQSLPDSWYSKRATYRAIVLSVVPGLRKLDGVVVGSKERGRLGRVLGA